MFVARGPTLVPDFLYEIWNWLDLLNYDLIPVYQIRQSYRVINNIRRNTKITRIVIEVLISDSRILAALYEIWIVVVTVTIPP